MWVQTSTFAPFSSTFAHLWFIRPSSFQVRPLEPTFAHSTGRRCSRFDPAVLFTQKRVQKHPKTSRNIMSYSSQASLLYSYETLPILPQNLSVFYKFPKIVNYGDVTSSCMKILPN